MSPRIMIPALAAFLFAPLSQTARGDALELDGSGDYVTFLGAGVPSGGAPFTIEAWINPTGPTSGSNRTMRGGRAGYSPRNTNAELCRSAYRASGNLYNRSAGVRIVRNAP